MKDSHHPLSTVADDELLRRLAELVGCSRRTEAELVAHIAEVEARRLYAREASPSMFAYCTEVLHLSEAEAYLRICAARASREHPVLLVMLGDGRLHLSGIAKLAPHLTAANRDGLLARAAHRSKRQIVELIAQLLPRPDAPDRITRLRDASGRLSLGPLPAASASPPAGSSSLPTASASLAAGSALLPAGPAPLPAGPAPLPAEFVLLPATPSSAAAPQVPVVATPRPRAAHYAGQLRPDAVGVTPTTTLAPTDCDATASAKTWDRPAFRGAAPAASIEPLAGERYKVQFTASRELCAKLKRLRALLPSAAALDLASIIELAVTEKIERMEARRFGGARRHASDAAVEVVNPTIHGAAAGAARPAGSAAPSPLAPGSATPGISRYIPVDVRRAVHERDGDRCTYRDDAGRRCAARGRLEFHHLHPFAMGGEHSARNVRLVCHAHNAYLAEVDYGRTSLSRRLGRPDLS